MNPDTHQEIPVNIARRAIGLTICLQTLQAYRFKDGAIVPLVLLAVVIVPTAAAYIRGVLSWQGRP